MQLEFHPAANEFPMLDQKRLDELAEDIRTNGQREPIRTYKNQIIDGRNRYEACKKLGIEPDVEPLPDNIDPYLYVWSLNGERRDLAAAQRYGIWKNCMEKSEEWRSKQRKIQEEANRKRAEAAKQQETRGNRYVAPKQQEKERANEKNIEKLAEETGGENIEVQPQVVAKPQEKKNYTETKRRRCREKYRLDSFAPGFSQNWLSHKKISVLR